MCDRIKIQAVTSVEVNGIKKKKDVLSIVEELERLYQCMEMMENM